MNMKHIRIIIVAGCMAMLAQADVLEFSTIDSGSYDSTGFHDPNDQSYEADYSASRNFFVFDFGAGGVGDAVTSATFRVNVYDANGGFFGNTFVVREIDDVAGLVAGGSSMLEVYGAMGSGLAYGTTTITSGHDNQYIDIQLGTAALSSINASGGLWAIAGNMSFSSIGAEFQNSQFDLGNKLILNTIPEPATMGLMGLFTGGLWFARRFFPSV